jgi:hypothetical protein
MSAVDAKLVPRGNHLRIVVAFREMDDDQGTLLDTYPVFFAFVLIDF